MGVSSSGGSFAKRPPRPKIRPPQNQNDDAGDDDLAVCGLLGHQKLDVTEHVAPSHLLF